MIETIITFINARLATIEMFETLLGLVHQIREKENFFPAEYCTKDNYDEVNIDFHKGIVYHRENGAVTISEDEENSVSCDILQSYVYSMKMIVAVKKDILSKKNDDQYIEHKVAQNISNIVNTKNSSVLAASLKADSVGITVTGFEPDRYVVWAEEYSVPMEAGFDWVFMRVNYQITITASQSCFDDFDCESFVIPSFCPVCDLGDFTHQELNNQMTQTQRDIIQRRIPIKTGVTTSILANDDGDTELGFDLSFLTLNTNNSFGNTNRFTDAGGLQVYGDNYAIDHFTGLGWRLTLSVDTAGNLITEADGLTFATFSDWRLCNIRELESILDYARSISGILNYAPFNVNPLALSSNFHSSSIITATQNLFVNATSTGSNQVIMVGLISDAGRSGLFVRNHFS